MRKADIDTAALTHSVARCVRTRLGSRARSCWLPCLERSLAVLDEALARLLARGVIIERGKQFLIPRPDEDRARAAERSGACRCRLRRRCERAGLTPPNPGEIVTSPQSKRAVDRLLRERVIVRAVDRAKGREILFHRDAIAEAQRRLAPLLDQRPDCW